MYSIVLCATVNFCLKQVCLARGSDSYWLCNIFRTHDSSVRAREKVLCALPEEAPRESDLPLPLQKSLGELSSPTGARRNWSELGKHRGTPVRPCAYPVAACFLATGYRSTSSSKTPCFPKLTHLFRIPAPKSPRMLCPKWKRLLLHFGPSDPSCKVCCCVCA